MWLGKDMFCCCGFKTDSGNKMAKHLATSGCSTAYPDAETASKALRGASWGGTASLAPTVTSAGDVGEIMSYDPNEEMAKAYMKDKGNAERSEPEGPLAFLGLQQKKDEEGEVDDATKEAKNGDCEGSKKDEDPKDAVDSCTQDEGTAAGVNVSEQSKGEEEADTSAVEDQQVVDAASTEPEVTESEETTTRPDTEVGVTAMDTSDAATKELGEQGSRPPAAASGPTEPSPQADTVGEMEAAATSSQELATEAENSAEDAHQAVEAATATPAAAAEDTLLSLAADAMETD